MISLSRLTVILSGVGYIDIYSLLVEFVNSLISGGYCGGVPPLPIPNREVKPACADGTAMQCGRVGGRHFFQREALESARLEGFLFLLLAPECSWREGPSRPLRRHLEAFEAVSRHEIL